MNGTGTESPRSLQSGADGMRRPACRVDLRALGFVSAPRRPGRFALRVGLLLGLTVSPGCVDLIPDVDWESASPFGGGGLGGRDSGLGVGAPGVVTSSEVPQPSPRVTDAFRDLESEEAPVRSEAPPELPVLDDELRAAIARATVATDPEENDPPELDPPELGPLEFGPPELGPPELEPPEANDPVAGIESPSATALEAPPAVPAEPEPEPTLETPAEAATTQPPPEEAPVVSIPDDDRGGRAGSAPDLAQPAPRAEELLTAPPTHTSATLSDLGFWFGRPVVTENKLPVGVVSDVRIDLVQGRVVDVVVQLRLWGAFGVPLYVFLPVELLEDNLPLLEVFVLTDTALPVPVANTNYADLVRLAFEREAPTLVEGTVQSVAPTDVEGGPPLAIVIVRDAENILQRLDLGELAWFDPEQELPVEGATFRVQAVKSRDERGPVWHVASILTEDGPVAIRDDQGGPLRLAVPVEKLEPELWSVRGIIGRSIQCRSGDAAPGPLAGQLPADQAWLESAVIAGLLMERDTQSLAYVLLRPNADGVREDSTWLLPFHRLQAGLGFTNPQLAEAAAERSRGQHGDGWEIDLDRSRFGAVPRLVEGAMAELDDPQRRIEIEAFWH